MIENVIGVSIPRDATDAEYDQACLLAEAFTHLFNLPVHVMRPYGVTFQTRRIDPPSIGVSTEGAAWAAESGRP